MKTGKTCIRCLVGLVPNENWSEGLVRSNTYLCRSCNSQKGKDYYAKNAQKVLEQSRAKAKTKEGAAQRTEYGSKFYAEHRDRWKVYHATRRKKENSDPWARSQKMLAWIRIRAARTGREFDLTREWIANKLVAGVCEVTGLPFDLGRDSSQRFNPWGPSIDRIDSRLGYTQDNCRAVVWIYNMAKSEWDDEVVLKFASALVNRNT